MMKYKTSKNHKKHPGFYPYEANAVEWVLNNTETGETRHPACFLMEAADDIAYLSADVEDALKFGLFGNKLELALKLSHLPILDDNYNVIRASKWETLILEKDPLEVSSTIIKALIKHAIEGLVKAVSNKALETLPKEMEKFICDNGFDDQPLNFVYWGAFGSANNNLKNFVYQETILKTKQVGQGEILAEKILSGLWTSFLPLVEHGFKDSDAYKVVPEQVQEKIRILHDSGKAADPERFQVIADYISGMSDRYAIYVWESLNSPSRLTFVA